jgi:DNA-binding GntR family transcriptional regulator
VIDGLSEIEALDGARTIERLVLEKLRRLILDGTLKPGQALKQEEIAARLGVSKTPVQHALKQLQVQGYVTARPHHSVVVAPLSADEIEELYAMRVGLERLAARLATPRLTTDVVDRLRALHHEETAAVTRGDLAEVLQLDREFHLVLYRLTGRPSLIRRIGSLREQCERYMRINLSLPGQLEESMAGHTEILEACAARDPEQVTEHVVGHLEQIAGRLIRATRSRTEATAG